MSDLHVGATPRDLVPGDPEAVAGLAARLGVLATGLGDAGVQLRVIQLGEWQGPAADAFDAVRDQQPGHYDVVAAAFTVAGSALTGYAAVLSAAQDQAGLAIDAFEQAVAASQHWQRLVGDGTVPLPSLDPGAAGRHRAELLLADARRWVDDAGRQAARLLDGAREGAPDEPTLFDRVVDPARHLVTEYVGGVVESTVGLGRFLWSVSWERVIVDPDGWARTVDELVEGVELGIENPVEILQAWVDWDTWVESPARALGHLVPGIVLAVVTSGTGAPASAAAQSLEAVGRVQQVATVLTRLREAALAAEPAITGRGPLDPRALPGLRPVDARLAVAVDPAVDLERITPPPVWRTGHEPLYRADDRPPEVIFEDGFAPRDISNVDLEDFVEHNTYSAFVSTTRSEQLIVEWNSAWWYHIDAPGGVDVNATLGPHDHADQQEIAFPGGIDEGSIVGAQSYDASTGQLGPFIPNPNYDPIP